MIGHSDAPVPPNVPSPWPRRWALLLSAVTFPLVWVGGLVTTYDAGMAVPDWPGTYGYNMFAYPLVTWWHGPWDLFIEHGHRLLGSAAGVVTIALTVSLLRHDRRRWVRRLGIVALVLVVAQGALGGIRVLAVDKAIAMVHGCVGPLFFTLAVVIAVVTGRGWMSSTRDERTRLPGLVGIWSVLVFGLAYGQLVLGANLRHVSVEADPLVYRSIVVAHVVGALLTWVHATAVAATVRRRAVPVGLRRFTTALIALVSIQLALGAGTWIVKFGWPWGLAEWFPGVAAVPEAKSLAQANVVTASVAIGSAILATSGACVVWILPLISRSEATQAARKLKGVPA